jgi:hypothetical protein
VGSKKPSQTLEPSRETSIGLSIMIPDLVHKKAFDVQQNSTSAASPFSHPRYGARARAIESAIESSTPHVFRAAMNQGFFGVTTTYQHLS